MCGGKKPKTKLNYQLLMESWPHFQGYFSAEQQGQLSHICCGNNWLIAIPIFSSYV